jgi:hypothetical protein
VVRLEDIPDDGKRSRQRGGGRRSQRGEIASGWALVRRSAHPGWRSSSRCSQRVDDLVHLGQKKGRG